MVEHQFWQPALLQSDQFYCYLLGLFHQILDYIFKHRYCVELCRIEIARLILILILIRLPA